LADVLLEGVWKVYRDGYEVVALRDINLFVEGGEFVAVMGPSGSGKTTLLNVISGLDRPTRGRVLVRGMDLTAMGEDELARFRLSSIGIVFQFYNLLPEMTCAENVALPLIARGLNVRAAIEEALRMLEKVGLADRAHITPDRLSGGEQQRCAVVRALATSPSLILADEPTGNLDSRSKREVMELLRNVNEDGVTVIVVTHDPEVASYSRRVIRLRDGSIVEDRAK